MQNCDLCGLQAKAIHRFTVKGREYKVCGTCCVDAHETLEFLEHGQFVLAVNREPPPEPHDSDPSGERSNPAHR